MIDAVQSIDLSETASTCSSMPCTEGSLNALPRGKLDMGGDLVELCVGLTGMPIPPAYFLSIGIYHECKRTMLFTSVERRVFID